MLAKVFGSRGEQAPPPGATKTRKGRDERRGQDPAVSPGNEAPRKETKRLDEKELLLVTAEPAAAASEPQVVSVTAGPRNINAAVLV